MFWDELVLSHKIYFWPWQTLRFWLPRVLFASAECVPTESRYTCTCVPKRNQRVLSACEVLWGWVTQQDKCVISCQKRNCHTLKMCICEKRPKGFILKVSNSKGMKREFRCRNPQKGKQCAASDCRIKCLSHIYSWPCLINIKTLV